MNDDPDLRQLIRSMKISRLLGTEPTDLYKNVMHCLGIEHIELILLHRPKQMLWPSLSPVTSSTYAKKGLDSDDAAV